MSSTHATSGTRRDLFGEVEPSTALIPQQEAEIPTTTNRCDSEQAIIRKAYSENGYCVENIEFRVADGYLNATALCDAFGKKWYAFRRLPTTQATLDAMSAELNLPIEADDHASKSRMIIDSSRTRLEYGGGTWIHPWLAVDLAAWCYTPFRVRMLQWTYELLSKGRVELPGANAERVTPELAYSFRNVHMADWLATHPIEPQGYWIVFFQATNIWLPVERALHAAGVPISRYALIDGSIGKRWRFYRDGCRSASWIRGDPVEYFYTFPDGRSPNGVVRECRAYHPAEIDAFCSWLYNVYVPLGLPDYLVEHYSRKGAGRARGQEVLRQILPALVAGNLLIDPNAAPGSIEFKADLASLQRQELQRLGRNPHDAIRAAQRAAYLQNTVIGSDDYIRPPKKLTESAKPIRPVALPDAPAPKALPKPRPPLTPEQRQLLKEGLAGFDRLFMCN